MFQLLLNLVHSLLIVIIFLHSFNFHLQGGNLVFQLGDRDRLGLLVKSQVRGGLIHQIDCLIWHLSVRQVSSGNDEECVEDYTDLHIWRLQPGRYHWYECRDAIHIFLEELSELWWCWWQLALEWWWVGNDERGQRLFPRTRDAMEEFGMYISIFIKSGGTDARNLSTSEIRL